MDILWYLPNIAPGHGMLQRCRPKPLKSIINGYEPGVDMLQPPMTPSFGTEVDGDNSRINNDEEESKGVQQQQQQQPQKRDAKDMTSEKVLRAFDDSFELFENDGSSRVLAYTRALQPRKSLAKRHSLMNNVVGENNGSGGIEDHAAALMDVA